MKRKQLLGMVIMSALLMGYNHFFLKKPETPQKKENTFVSKKNNETSRAEDNSQKEKVLFTLVDNDREIKISNIGGCIDNLILKKYNHEIFEKVRLVNNGSSELHYILSLENGELISTKNLTFSEIKNNGKEITLCAENNLGYTIEITYSLQENYKIEETISVWKDNKNVTCKSAEIVWRSNLVPTEKDLKACRSKTRVNYLKSENDFKNVKESTSGMNDYINTPIKWLALKQRFFTSAIISQKIFVNTNVEVQPLDENNKEVVRVVSTKMQVESQDGKINLSFYYGPNDFYLMKKVAPKFYRNVPLGWGIFRWTNVFVIMPAFKFFSGLTSNMALIILIVVLLIKLLLYPITYRSHVSNIKMKHLKPKLDKIKETYKNNMQMIQMEQMKLYRSAGVNPFGSIGLLFLQMPILIAVFNFIPNEISFRLKEFLWVSDLSTFDSILNLPFSIPAYGNHVSLFTILMTLSTIIQSLTSSDLNAQQGNMKLFAYVMPLMFMFVLNNFPAALSLYYFVSNLITIIIQVLIKKLTNEEKITSFMDFRISQTTSHVVSSFAERMSQMMKKK